MTVSVSIPPLSQSRQALMACAHLYIARVIRGVEEPENPFALRGTQIHEALSAYVTHLVATRQPSDWEHFAKLLEAGYGSEAIEILEGLKESLVIDPEKVLGAEMHLALDADLNPVETEADELGALNPSAEPEFEGTLDLVTLEDERTAIIDDYKSFFQVIEPETFQAKLYPLLVFQHYPSVETVRFRLQFVRYGIERAVEYTRDQVPGLIAMARRERHRQLALHDEAKRELLDKPMPGAHCAYCPKLQNGCPIAEINPYITQSAEDRLRFAVWAQQALKVNAVVLRDLVAAGGPVEVADANGSRYIAEHRLVEQAKFPLIATVDSLAEWRTNTGEDLIPKLFVGATELKPLLKAKKRCALRERLEEVKVVKAGSRWTIGKVGDDADGDDGD